MSTSVHLTNEKSCRRKDWMEDAGSSNALSRGKIFQTQILNIHYND